MSYTGYVVDVEGYIRQINNEGGTNYDVLYSKDKYVETKRKDYDNTGNKTGIKMSKGIIIDDPKAAIKGRNMSRMIINGIDSDTGKTLSGHGYEVETDSESLNVMNFLEKNTTVEWSNTNFTSPSGKSINFLMTSHEETRVSFGSYQINKYVRKGFNVVRADHIHPGAGYNTASEGDSDVAKDILIHSPKAIFRILNEGKYYSYKP